MQKIVLKYSVVGLVIVISLVGLVLWNQSGVSVDSSEEKSAVQETERNFKIKGLETAPIHIIEFSDFQCPSCRRAQEPLKTLIEAFPGLIKVEARHFPLSMHAHALTASKAAECAGIMGKFWPYHDLLFEKQGVWSIDPDPKSLFFAYANDLELNIRELNACMDEPETNRRIQVDRQAGQALQVRSTPTFFINGERLVGSKQLEDQGPIIIKQKLSEMIGSPNSNS